MRDEDGATALLPACEGGHVECVKLLLKHGCPPGKPNRVGRTPVMTCCFGGQADCLLGLGLGLGLGQGLGVHVGPCLGGLDGDVLGAVGKYLVRVRAGVRVRVRVRVRLGFGFGLGLRARVKGKGLRVGFGPRG